MLRLPDAEHRRVQRVVEGLTHEVAAIRVEIQALILEQPPLYGADQELADALVKHLKLMGHECAGLEDYFSQRRMPAPPPDAPATPPSPDGS